MRARDQARHDACKVCRTAPSSICPRIPAADAASDVWEPIVQSLVFALENIRDRGFEDDHWPTTNHAINIGREALGDA